MVTIIVDTKEEYIKMKRYAERYVCNQIPFTKCGKYPTHTCYKCYKDNHIRCGMRVIPPVDNNKPDEL